MVVAAKLSRLCRTSGLVLLGLMAACAPQEPRDARDATPSFPPSAAARVDSHGQVGGELRYALAGEPDTFNYLAASDNRSKLVALLTSGTLLEFDAFAQQVTGGVADEYRLEGDGASVWLHLRDGLTFSDGRPVSSEDVAFSFDRLFDPASHNVLKDSLMVGGEPLRLEVVGDRELIVHANRPYAAIEYLLSNVPILPRHCLTDFSDRPIEEAWTLSTPPSEMAGLGPFKVSRHDPGIATTLERNPYYWKVDTSGTPLPYLDRVVLEYVSDRSAQVLRLSSGNLDLADQLRPEDFVLLQGREDLIAEDLGPSSNLSFLLFNLNDPRGAVRTREHGWFSKQAFRRAISSALNRQAIAGTVYSGLASPAFSFVSPANRHWYVDVGDLPDHDVDEARRLLAGAGFSWREDGDRTVLLDEGGAPVEFDLLTLSSDVLGRTAAVVRQDLSVIGIQAHIRQEEFRSVISRITRSRDFACAIMNLDFPLEPLDMANVLLTSGDFHVWRLPGGGDPEPWELDMDRIVGELATTGAPQARFALFERVQRIMAQQCPLIPLVNRNVLVVRRQSIQDLEVARVFPYAWARVWQVYQEQL